LKGNAKLPEHTDSTGKSFNTMACNMLLVGNGVLAIKHNNKYYKKNLRKGEAVIFDSE
jgi:hypothetical protein